jgi:hypothetical protein
MLPWGTLAPNGPDAWSCSSVCQLVGDPAEGACGRDFRSDGQPRWNVLNGAVLDRSQPSVHDLRHARTQVRCRLAPWPMGRKSALKAIGFGPEAGCGRSGGSGRSLGLAARRSIYRSAAADGSERLARLAGLGPHDQLEPLAGQDPVLLDPKRRHREQLRALDVSLLVSQSMLTSPPEVSGSQARPPPSLRLGSSLAGAGGRGLGLRSGRGSPRRRSPRIPRAARSPRRRP